LLAFTRFHARCIFSRANTCSSRPRPAPSDSRRGSPVSSLVTSGKASPFRSVLPRCPFRHKARYPRVRTHSFTAQPPDLRRIALATRASRLLARSPCSAVPHIRFLFIGSRFTLHASSQQLLALPQLRFTSFAVASLREDLHLQEGPCRAHKKRGRVFCRRLWLTIKRHTGLFREVRRRHCYSRLRRPCNLYQDWPTVR